MSSKATAHAVLTEEAVGASDLAVFVLSKVLRRLDGVQAQPRHPLSTASATTSLAIWASWPLD